MKLYDKIKLGVYILLAILVFIFNEELMDYIPYLVGSVMIIFGADGILNKVLKHEIEEEKIRFMDDCIIVGLGLFVMLALNKEFVSVCVIWAIWSILREEWEISEKVIDYKGNLVVKIVNLLESIVVVVLSLLLIIDPIEHCHAHVILLGIELLLEVLFPVPDLIIEKLNKK